MANLFQDYEALARSGLFDAKYYLQANPDVAALNVDPLLHYVEQGARQGRNPRADFDAAFYIEQCRARGEQPANPLLHYIAIGSGQGLMTRPSNGANQAALLARKMEDPAARADRVLCIDQPRIRNGAAEAPVTGNLIINGWAMARAGVHFIDIALDGQPLAKARHGIGRMDVAQAFPDRPGAALSGFAAFIPNRALPKGRHTISVRLVDAENRATGDEFTVQIEDLPEGEGPWSLRRKMPQAEIDLQMGILAALDWQPGFHFVLAMPGTTHGLKEVRQTLASLREQTYPGWSATLLVEGKGTPLANLRKLILAGFEEVAGRVRVGATKAKERLGDVAGERVGGAPGFVSALRAGDTLGCDALLELAMASGMQRDADFFYSDERRADPVHGKIEAFFKPGWSPDLLLSTNYVGRAWFARAELLRRAALTVDEWAALGDYEVVLRATEQARAIGHVPKVLAERTAHGGDAHALERKAIERALARRGAKATVQGGCLPGVYRVRRKKTIAACVSIVIPTRAAGGHIKTCLDSIREHTTYRNFEIVCIENIPADAPQWKAWLREHADMVLSTTEGFNWSRYNNLCAARCKGEFLLFLNDDVEITRADWLDVLLEHAERPEVGVVGPQLRYPDGSVQHAGLALAELGKAKHVFRHAAADYPGYFGLALTERNVIGVTGACLMTRREVFDKLGGFDEAHSIVNNDLDYCLRAWRAGYLNVYTPHTSLIHHELGSRAELGDAYDSSAFASRWRDVFLKGDPYLNPNLSAKADDLAPEREPARVLCVGHPLIDRASVRRILVVKLDHIGDCVTALPAVRRLKEHFPQARITVLANRTTRAIWDMEPAVEEFLAFDFFHARSERGKKDAGERELGELRGRLAPMRYDIAVDLRKGADTREVLQYTGARFLAGFNHRGEFGWLDIALEWEGDTQYVRKHRHVSDDLIGLADAVDASCRTERSFLQPDPAARLRLTAGEQRHLFAKSVVCVHPACGNELRQWPVQRFAELIDLIAANHDVHVALIGGADETALARQVMERVQHARAVTSLAGKLELAELPTLLARCALFIGNNSGPKHIAAALGVPTIGVHSGVVDANEWGPLGDRAVVIRREMACSPCYIDRASHCPYELACLHGLPAAIVYRQAVRMLALRSMRAAVALRESLVPKVKVAAGTAATSVHGTAIA